MEPSRGDERNRRLFLCRMLHKRVFLLPKAYKESENSVEEFKFLIDSINNIDDYDKLTPPEEKKHVFVKQTLPLIFEFKDEEPLPPDKEEREKEITK
ncbi:hypothetical protein H5410_003708 [Solanum commersonii]|uniref:Uncharacterized protein n=1 Tax=Solanum commersonii TaxID=4109 RepID=A0A9J6B6D9_SOLCO|nr:hypothetical protein H5410_003708 [Solanum commersonii]